MKTASDIVIIFSRYGIMVAQSF